MKKIITLMVTLIMGLSLLTGCGGDAVADEFEKFMNTDMVAVNAKYEDLKTELAKWSSYTDDAALISSLSNVLIPNINESLDMLSKIELTTDEVTAIRDKYETMLNSYKKAFESMLTAANAGDADAFAKATEMINDALNDLADYNAALEELAEEKGMTIEY